MGINEIFILITIVISYMAILVANNRKLILYKFNFRILIPIIICFLLINYLVFFDFFFELGAYIPFLVNDNCIPANIWAYIISICFLIVFFLYVGKCEYFPKTNNDKVIRYYKSLIYMGKTEMLVSYIEKYHLKGMEKLISDINRIVRISESNNKNKQGNNTQSEEKTATVEKDDSGSVLSKQPLNSRVFLEIITDSSFIGNAVKVSPLFLLEIFTKIESKEFDSVGLPNNFTNSIAMYFRELIKSHNKDFINELKQIWTKNSAIDPSVKEQIKDTKFLKYIFSEVNNLTFSFRFDIEKVFYDEAQNEVKTEKFWLENPDEIFYSKYYESASYQYLMFENVLMRYDLNKVNCNDIANICNCLSNEYGNQGTTNFAYDFVKEMHNMMIINKVTSENLEKISHYKKRFEERNTIQQ